SSCFPPVFDPMGLGLRPSQLVGGKAAGRADRDALVAGLRLTDGGTYDNMGLEPVWKESRCVLVSDGGSPFGFEPDPGSVWGLPARWMRYLAINSNQGR